MHFNNLPYISMRADHWTVAEPGAQGGAGAPCAAHPGGPGGQARGEDTSWRNPVPSGYVTSLGRSRGIEYLRKATVPVAGRQCTRSKVLPVLVKVKEKICAEGETHFPTGKQGKELVELAGILVLPQQAAGADSSEAKA